MMFKNMLCGSLLIFVACFYLANGRVMTPDQLRDELKRNNVPQWMIPTFVCIVKHESEFNTAARNTVTGDHGIFQISQIYWCSPPGTGCGMTCASLEDDDITNDIKCAMKVYDETKKLSGNGFSAWTTYHYCK